MSEYIHYVKPPPKKKKRKLAPLYIRPSRLHSYGDHRMCAVCVCRPSWREQNGISDTERTHAKENLIDPLMRWLIEDCGYKPTDIRNLLELQAVCATQDIVNKLSTKKRARYVNELKEQSRVIRECGFELLPVFAKNKKKMWKYFKKGVDTQQPEIKVEGINLNSQS